MVTSVSVDEKVLKEAKRVLREELNMTLSYYVEIQLRALIGYQTKSAKDVYDGIVQDMFENVRESQIKKRRSVK